MSDQKLKDLNDQLKKDNELLQGTNDQLRKNAEVQFDKAYKCNKCGDLVNFTFIMPAIKIAGQCPNCWGEEFEPKDLNKEKELLTKKLEAIQKEIDNSRK